MSSANAHTQSPKMGINHRAEGRFRVPRIVRLSHIEADRPSATARAAEKMSVSGRENVRFLTRHLKAYERYLELTPDLGNVLYLAYTITVHDDAPFKATDFRRHLAKAGIQTRSSFGFIHDPDDLYLELSPDHPINRLRDNSRHDSARFCLPCHQYMTILDLQHIVETCDTFFSQLAGHQNQSVFDG